MTRDCNALNTWYFEIEFLSAHLLFWAFKVILHALNSKGESQAFNFASDKLQTRQGQYSSPRNV